MDHYLHLGALMTTTNTTIEIIAQSDSAIEIKTEKTTVVEVATPGTQGPKGDQGIQGIQGEDEGINYVDGLPDLTLIFNNGLI